MMPITSYTPVGMPGNTPPCSMPSAMFATGMLTPHGQPQPLHSGPGHQQPSVQQQQQQLVFSGAPGNFFLAQSSAVGAPPMGAPLMLAPGQANSGGTFMVAQPMPSSGVPGAPMATSAPPNCIIRLPDGRLVMSATAPTPVGFNPSTMSRLPGAPTAYYSVPMSSGPPGNGNSPQQPQPAGTLLNPNPGQAFFIQVPSNPVSGFGGTMMTAVSTTSSMSFQSQPQSAGLLKPVQAISCVSSSPFSSRNPLLMPVAVSGSQTPCIMSPKTSGTSSPNTLGATTNQAVNTSLIQCTTTNPMDPQVISPKLCSMVGVSSASVQNFQAGGMTVACLPNGTYTTLAYSRPQTPTCLQTSCTTPGINGPMPLAPTPPMVGSVQAQRKTSVSRPNSRPQLSPSSTVADSTEVLRRLDEQIILHQNTPNPSEAQTAKLKQLIEARNQLAKTMAATGTARPADSSNLATGNRRPPWPQVPVISPSLRRELLNMLAKNNLLPSAVNPASADTFVVEFRLNQQQYRLRLTRAQKADMERLLYSVRSQRQAEILTVLQQEQNRFLSSRPRISVAPVALTTVVTTTCSAAPRMLVSPSSSVSVTGVSSPTPTFGSTPNLVTQQVRLQTPIQSFAPNHQTTMGMQPHTFGQTAAPGLRLVATRPVLQPATGLAGSLIRGPMNPAVPGLCNPTGTPVVTNNTAAVSTHPMMGVVTALAMPPMASQGPGTQIFASGLGSSGSATVVPHAISTMPVSGSAVPGTLGSSTTGAPGPGLFLSSFPPSMSGSQTFVMQQSVMVPSSTGSMPLPANCTLIQQPATPNQSAPLQPGGVPQTAPVQLKQSQTQSTHIQPQQSQLTIPQPIRTPTPVRTSTSPPGRAALGLSLQQAARLSRMRAYLSHDLKSAVEKPSSMDICFETPPLPTELLQNLASYHVLRDADNTDEALEKVERVLDTSIGLLFERKRQTIQAVDALLFKQTMEQLQPPVEDRLLLSQMALDLERDVLASEKQDFSEVLAETDETGSAKVPRTNLNSGLIQDTELLDLDTDQKPIYLRHSTSLLPAVWQSMLGSLAFLRPLAFDASGCAKYASIDLPSTPNDSQSQTSESKHESGKPENGLVNAELSCDPDERNEDHTLTCAAPKDTSDCDSRARTHEDDDVDAMSDDVEADLLLGLDTRQSRGSVSVDPLVVTNGGQRCGSSGVGLCKRGRDKCVAFEETYNLWQEFMREEGIDIDMEDGNEDDDDGLGADALDTSLDSNLGSMLPGNSTRESQRGSDNGPGSMTVGMQHSEDPDIDAAIRSILSTTN
ncbi:hypothetical protein D915_003252 [Fasciola hepatica]|uniref:Uncharacterized protein n=1 Tax=Fasciola hepatica TaxID=6192 RepID=A0A4E0RB17_FASHE|nr:hypothetical protein D915_003252 [Fasciola hepatica]